MYDTTSRISAPGRDSSDQRSTEFAFQLKALINALPDAVVVVDPAGKIVFVNNRTEELSGFHPSDLVGRRVDRLLPGITPGIIPGAPRRTVPALELSRQDGSPVTVDVEVGALELDGKTFSVASVRDVSHRQGDDTDLLAKETDFRTTVEDSPAVVVTLTNDGVITWANGAWEEMTGLDRADWIGRHIVDTWHPDDIASGIRGLRRVVDDNEPEPLATQRVRTTSGQYRAFESATVRLVYKGRVHGAMSIGRDATGPGTPSDQTAPDETAPHDEAGSNRRVEPSPASSGRRLRVRTRRDPSERLAELRRDLDDEPSNPLIDLRDIPGPASPPHPGWKPIARGTWKVNGDGAEGPSLG